MPKGLKISSGGLLQESVEGIIVRATVNESYQIDASAGSIWRLTLTDGLSLVNPSNPTDGQKIRIWLIQDATGLRTLSLTVEWLVPASITVTLTATPNAVDLLEASYDQDAGVWRVTSFVAGYMS